MKEYKTITIEEHDNIATVKVQWEDPSVLDATVVKELLELLDYLEDESDCKLISFIGFGAKTDKADAGPPDLELCHKWEKILRRIERFAGAHMICIDGFCTYFHLQLALICDYRIATNESVFQSPEISKGYLPGMSVYRLVKYTGMGPAKRFLFTAEQWSCDQGSTYGIIDCQCESSELEQKAEQIIEVLKPMNGQTLLNARRLVNETYSATFEDAIGNFLAVQNKCLFDLEQAMSKSE